MDITSSSASPAPRPMLLQRAKEIIRLKHYSMRTEDAYVQWIRRFMRFHGWCHPDLLGKQEVEAFLSHLAVEGNVAAATQNQALNAIVFLYRHVLERELDWLDNVQRAKRPVHVPVVFTVDEVGAVLARMDGTRWLMAAMLYGCGLRLTECLRLRVKDIDFDRRAVLVRNGKGGKDRVTVLPDRLLDPLELHLQRVRTLHAEDLASGRGAVHLPHALARKYPGAERD